MSKPNVQSLVALSLTAWLMLPGGRTNAGTLTWTGSVNGTWNTSAANWSGDATVYTDGAPGDAVNFNGGSNPAIAIGATYTPASVTFNNPTVNFTFTGGGISGAGALSKAGAADAIFDATTSFAGYSGAIGLTGGRLLRQQNSGAGSFGSGVITLDGGALGVKYTTGWVGTTTITNPIAVTATGGTIVGVYFNGNNAAYTGGLTLNSGSTLNLDASGAVGNTYFVYLGKATLLGNASIRRNLTFTDSFLYNQVNGSGQIYLNGAVSGAGSTLTLDGINMRLQATGSLTVSNLVVAKELWVESRSGTAFVTLGAGGTVRVATNGLLALNHTTLDASRLELDDGATLQRIAGGWNGDLMIANALTVQSNRTVWLGVHTGGDAMAFTAGATFQAGSRMVIGPNTRSRTDGQWGAGFSGTARFLGGATIEGVILRAAGTCLYGSHPLVLGDADSNTAETITIKGRGPGVLAFKATSVTDIGGVTLRYEAATNTAPFKVGWGAVGWNDNGAYKGYLTSPLIGGSAGTRFAPKVGTGENGSVIVVGPTNGTVFLASTPATVVSAGTVAFRQSVAVAVNNWGSWYAGDLGPVAVTGTGSLAFTAAATVSASKLTFASGSVLSVRLTGEAADACSLLDVTGTLTFDAGATLAVTLADGFVGKGGPWRIATVGTLSGLPTTPGYGLTLSGDDLMLARLPRGTAIIIQ